MTLDDPELLTEFVAEAREHLAGVENKLLDIEASGADINIELVNNVFRAVHSIKGAAGFMGLGSVNELAHSLENVLDKMRNRELAPGSSTIDTMLRATDALTKLVSNLDSAEAAQVSPHVEALEAIVHHQDSFACGPAEEADMGPRSAHRASDIAGGQPPIVPRIAPVESASGNVEAASSITSARCETHIRVPVGVLDRLLDLAGELVLVRNQLMQSLNQDSRTGFERIATRLDFVTSELQDAIMQTRMQPIGNVFGRFPRLVRDVTARLAKQCDVLIEGKEVEVDRTIIEAISDPLTHLVRNAIDHGIELPAERIARNKPVAGRVHLRAYHQAGKVRIDVQDDGRGIDPERLRQKAVAIGFITADHANRMSDRDAIRLILEAGFSTAEHVTDLSGRGVGMDVVRANIENVGGSVDIESVLGRGTTIQITLPLTLAIIPALVVESGGQRFAIPQANVLELLRVRSGEIGRYVAWLHGAEVLRLRGTMIPLLRLATMLGTPADQPLPTDSSLNFAVLDAGHMRYALAVDKVVDSEEIVVKPVGPHLKSSPAIAGATILGDGRVSLILDVAGVATSVGMAACEPNAI